MKKAVKSPPLKPEQLRSIRVVAAYLAIVAVVTIGATLYLWPSVALVEGKQVATNFTVEDNSTIVLGGGKTLMSYQKTVLFLGLLGGSIGGLAYSMAYLGRYAGTADYNANWEVWYFSHPVLGAILGLGVLGVLKGASAVVEAFGDINVPSAPLAIFGIGVLAGVAQWSVLKWLDARASTLFRVKDADRSGEDGGGGSGGAGERSHSVEIAGQAREHGEAMVVAKKERGD